jgi:hypothetical protein
MRQFVTKVLTGATRQRASGALHRTGLAESWDSKNRKRRGEENMPLENSKIIPAAFWVGFLALGFVTSVGGPNKHRMYQVAQPTRAAVAPKAVVAQTEKPIELKASIKAATQD